jgi:hypothetical protein
VRTRPRHRQAQAGERAVGGSGGRSATAVPPSASAGPRAHVVGSRGPRARRGWSLGRWRVPRQRRGARQPRQATAVATAACLSVPPHVRTPPPINYLCASEVASGSKAGTRASWTGTAATNCFMQYLVC